MFFMWLPGEAADREAGVAAVVAGRIDVVGAEAEHVGIASIRVRSGRPIAPIHCKHDTTSASCACLRCA